MQLNDSVLSDQKLSTKRKVFFYLLLFLIPLVAIASIYLVYTTYRSHQLYNYIKSNQRGWSGKIHEAHKELGFAPIPNSRGLEIMPIGAAIPMRYDNEGFRIPIEDQSITKNDHPVVLALGCSFTYGAATPAEHTFPYLVGNYLGVSTKNAGVCSYGLSQMVILAKRLIPRHNPDYVIVQYSPWLVKRAVRPLAPSYYGKIPTPYYADEENPTIKPSIFQTKIFDLPIDRYRNSQAGVVNYFSFLANVGLPLFIHDDFHMTAYTVANVLRLKDPPTENRAAVIQHAYREISKVAQLNGAKLIIVILGEDHNAVSVQRDLLPNSAIVVDAHSALLIRLPKLDKQTYQREYNHWRGDPPVLVDGHPNEKAHRIIAEKIVTQIVGSPEKLN